MFLLSKTIIMANVSQYVSHNADMAVQGMGNDAGNGVKQCFAA
jgi:hypothetical protein